MMEFLFIFTCDTRLLLLTTERYTSEFYTFVTCPHPQQIFEKEKEKEKEKENPHKFGLKKPLTLRAGLASG